MRMCEPPLALLQATLRQALAVGAEQLASSDAGSPLLSHSFLAFLHAREANCADVPQRQELARLAEALVTSKFKCMSPIMDERSALPLGDVTYTDDEAASGLSMWRRASLATSSARATQQELAARVRAYSTCHCIARIQ